MTNIPKDDSGSSHEVDVDAARKYHVLMELGRGGTAVVNAGLARGPGGFTKLVVLKNIKEEFLSDRDTVRMFVNEARLSARMNHPNIVQVYEVFRQDRLPVIVMEHIDGQSLARIQPRAFHDPSYTTAMAISILCGVLAGLQYAHTLADYDGTLLEIVHRDVSPQNVMLTYDGQVKLLDFGIAKLSSSSSNTKTGVVKGKIAYMAPEQLEGGALDHRCDLFAVGVMLWEAIARRRMWGARSDAEIVRCLVLDEIPKLRQVLPSVDAELEQICEKALALSPDDRYPTAEHFKSALEGYLDRRGLVVRQQDLADMVSRICADLRDNSAELLKAELAKFAAADPGWEDALSAFEEHTPLPESGERRHRWRPFAIVAVVLFGMVAAIYSWFAEPLAPGAALTPSPVPPRPAPTPTPIAAAVPPPTPTEVAPSAVTLRVRVAPSDATVVLDGKPLAGSPPSVRLTKDELEHDLRVEARGYQAETRTLRLLDDTELKITLKELPSTTPPKPAPTPPSTRRRPPRTAARAPAPTSSREERPAEPARGKPIAGDCDPPFYIGSDGLKHYRRECL